MSGHTPGPWEYLQADGVVVHQNDPRGYREIGWSDADYRLIAAAPELLAALRQIGYEPFGPSDATPEQVLDAITTFARTLVAKAEGRS